MQMNVKVLNVLPVPMARFKPRFKLPNIASPVNVNRRPTPRFLKNERYSRKHFFRHSIVVAPESLPGSPYFTVASQNSRRGWSEIMHVLRLFMRTPGKQWCCQYVRWIVEVPSETENLLVHRKIKRKGRRRGRRRPRRRRRRRPRRQPRW